MAQTKVVDRDVPINKIFDISAKNEGVMILIYGLNEVPLMNVVIEAKAVDHVIKLLQKAKEAHLIMKGPDVGENGTN